MEEIKDMLHLDVMTVTGKTLGENLEDMEASGFFTRNLGYLANYGLTRDDVIFPIDKAEEIGRILGIPKATVHTRLVRGREKLKPFLEEYGYE